MNKKIILIIISMVIITVLISCIQIDKDYTITYKINGLEIKENYIASKRLYLFSTTYENNNYEIGYISNNIHKKNLIKNIDIIDEEKYACIYLKSDKLNLYPICKNEDGYGIYDTISTNENIFKYKKIEALNKEYEKIKINYYPSKSLLIWNHKGYNYISEKGNDKLELIKTETYKDLYSYQIDEYLLLPDYDQKYSFDKYYVIDMKTGKVKTWNLDISINYNFYYLGQIDNKVYIVDRKAKKEYELNVKKQIITDITKNNYGKVWNNGWNEVSITKLVNTDYTFKNDNPIDYYINDSTLYGKFYNSNSDIKITNKKVDKIINVKDDRVYYLVKNQIYTFSLTSGENLVIEYSELEFNDGTTTYIY